MRYNTHTTAEDVLHTPRIEIFWPQSAHNALAKHFLGVDKSFPKFTANDDPSEQLTLTSKESAWEWETDTLDVYDENGDSDTVETRKELFLSEHQTNQLDATLDTLHALCESLGIPADMRQIRADGSERFIQVRPLSPEARLSSSRFALAESKERSEQEPRIDLAEALNMALSCDSIEALREALREDLQAARFDTRLEQCVAEFNAQWPDGSFEKACFIFKAGLPNRHFGINPPTYKLPDSEPPSILDSINERGASKESALSLFLNSACCGWDRAVGSCKSLMERATEANNPQAEVVVIEALAQWTLDRGRGSAEGALLLCKSLCDRFDRGLDTDFSGAVGSFLNRVDSTAAKFKNEDLAAFEALSLRAQTLPAAQKRRHEGSGASRPPPRI